MTDSEWEKAFHDWCEDYGIIDVTPVIAASFKAGYEAGLWKFNDKLQKVNGGAHELSCEIYDLKKKLKIAVEALGYYVEKFSVYTYLLDESRGIWIDAVKAKQALEQINGGNVAEK